MPRSAHAPPLVLWLAPVPPACAALLPPLGSLGYRSSWQSIWHARRVGTGVNDNERKLTHERRLLILRVPPYCLPFGSVGYRSSSQSI